MSNGWTSERRARQAALIVNWKPWGWSCGPKTELGKLASSWNARRHGMRSRGALEEARMLRSLIRRCRDMSDEVDQKPSLVRSEQSSIPAAKSAQLPEVCSTSWERLEGRQADHLGSIRI
jgi:hypothetical protein